MNFFLQKLEFFFKRYIIILVLVGIIGISLRFYFLDFDIPVHSDSFEYFRIANDLALGEEIESSLIVKGWPTFLSIFFSFYESSNFLDYHTLQRILSAIISVITIFPCYLLCRVFFDKRISIISSSFFIFEPHIIQNSILGLSEPLFILIGTISLALFFQNKSRYTIISFILLASFVYVRSEGIALFGICSIIFFVRNGIKKNQIITYLISLSLFLAVLFVLMSINPSSEKDVLFHHIDGAVSNVFSTNPSNNFSVKLVSGVEVLIKKLGQTIFPYFLAFVPLGIFLLLKQRNKNNISLLLILILGLMASLYIFSRINDIRYIFWLYPIFCVISGFTLERISRNFNKKHILLILIFTGMIIMTIFLISSNDLSDRNKEALQFSFYINDNFDKVTFYFQSGYTQYASLEKLDKFPIPSKEFPKSVEIINPIICCNTINEFIEFGKSEGIKHIVVDNTSKKISFFDDVFDHEQKYPYLKKIYDTKENGYEYYHAKIFVINFDDFDKN